MKHTVPEKYSMYVSILCPGFPCQHTGILLLEINGSDQKHLFMKTGPPVSFHNKLGQVVEQSLYLMLFLLLERPSFFLKPNQLLPIV